MTLKQLEAFYWAARCASFAIAAERLHLSISSLSKRITELEDSLGVALFDRSGHKAVLRDAGHRLLPRALALLQSAADIRGTIGVSESLSGICAFGAGELSALTWLPRFIAEIRTHYPTLQLEPHIEVGAMLEERLEKGEIDFAVIAGRSSRQSILSLSVASAQFVWVASPALLNVVGTIDNALCQGVPLIALPPGAGTTRIIDDWLMVHDVAAVERINCNNWGAIAGLLIASVGVGILPRSWAEYFSECERLQITSSKVALAELYYAFQWRRGDVRPLIQSMRRLAENVADFSLMGHLPL